MSIQEIILGGIVVGVGATLAMDIWNLFLKRVFKLPSLNYCLLGRWILHIPRGTLRHASIANAAPKPRECLAGWISHYTIGIGLSLGLLALTSGRSLTQPALLPALFYGIVTVIFPFFILQPSLGLGIASAKTANPSLARMKSLMTHVIFGLGLYICALAVSRFIG